MKVVVYEKSRCLEWDAFVSHAKNGHFIFLRDYMDYHQDRFMDASLMIYEERKLLAVFPANIQGEIVYSHQGLTFGGLIMSRDLKALLVFEIFSAIIDFYKKNNIKKIMYKAIPHIYHQYPAEEDLYVLYRMRATLIRRDITTTICMSDRLPFSTLRSRHIRKAMKNGVYVKSPSDFSEYWKILAERLQESHGCLPVHSMHEIEALANRFPNNIQLFAAYSVSHEMLAGALIYCNRDTVHVQYIAASDEGRQTGAFDLVVHYLLFEKYSQKKWFDFGISTENSGMYLNEGLIFQKEGFGARGIVQDCYEIIL